MDDDNLVLLLQQIDQLPDDEHGEHIVKLILVYTFSNTSSTPQEIRAKVELLNQQKTNYMSTLDQFIAEGRQEGRQEGIALGEERGRVLSAKIIKRYLKGESATAIALLLDTPVEKVAKIIADYEAA